MPTISSGSAARWAGTAAFNCSFNPLSSSPNHGRHRALLDERSVVGCERSARRVSFAERSSGSPSVRWHGKRRSRDSGRAMSQENVEIVRHIYESGLFDRDPEELLRLATADVEYVNPPYAVEPGVRRGLVAVAQAMRRFAEVWDESRHELRELYDCGDIVVAAVSWHILSRGSERALVNKEAHTWTLRGGRIARFEWGQDLGKALDAAGGPE
jgi:ketosteroid isomerase-like protein